MICITAIVGVHGALSTIPTGIASYYTTHYHNMSAYDFSMHEDKQVPYVNNPAIEQYFSRYGREDFIGYLAMKEIFDSPEQLADLQATVSQVHDDPEVLWMGCQREWMG